MDAGLIDPAEVRSAVAQVLAMAEVRAPVRLGYDAMRLAGSPRGCAHQSRMARRARSAWTRRGESVAAGLGRIRAERRAAGNRADTPASNQRSGMDPGRPVRWRAAPAHSKRRDHDRGTQLLRRGGNDGRAPGTRWSRRGPYPRRSSWRRRGSIAPQAARIAATAALFLQRHRELRQCRARFDVIIVRDGAPNGSSMLDRNNSSLAAKADGPEARGGDTRAGGAGPFDN
jgi:hypothetical protein